MFRRPFGALLAFVLVLSMASLASQESTAQNNKTESGLSGLATVAGMVKAPKPFKAAQVYFRNIDKRILFMVYTREGRYQGMNLFPGTYEVSVKAKDLDSEVQTVVLRPGKNGPIDLTLRPRQTAEWVSGYWGHWIGSFSGNPQFASFGEIYPPGPGFDIARGRCIGCHQPNFLPSKQWNSTQWNSAINLMLSLRMMEPITDRDRATIVEYLTKNFGPDSKPRVVKWDTEMPVDEEKLSKAMYIEYYFKPTPGKDSTTGPFIQGRRVGQDPHFDRDGNVWVTDRGTPNNLLTKLDPRTGEIREWVMPSPATEAHGLTIDSDGIVWVADLYWKPELYSDLYLNAFNPKTEKFERYPIDPNHTLGKTISAHTPVLDSKQNVWISMIGGDAIAKWDRKTKKITLYKTPTTNSRPYGIDVDQDDNIWIAEYIGGQVGKFNTFTEEFTEFSALTHPSTMRRVSVDSKGIVWYGLHTSGILGRLDPKTGKITEVKLPHQFSQPYDVWPDHDDNIWISDGGMGGALIKYEPKSGAFSYYPAPQLTDQPKLEITREGAVWYAPRSGREAGVGVLYPDTTKITTLGAYYPAYDPTSSKYALKKINGRN